MWKTLEIWNISSFLCTAEKKKKKKKKNQFFDISELTKWPPAVLNLRVHKGTLIDLLLRAGKAVVTRKEKTYF